MLVLGRYLEKAKDQQKDEQVIHAEGEFDYISSDELKSGSTAVPEKYNDCEYRSHADPSQTPKHGFTDLHSVSATMEDPEIKGQHGQNEHVEKNPEERLVQANLVLFGHKC